MGDVMVLCFRIRSMAEKAVDSKLPVREVKKGIRDDEDKLPQGFPSRKEMSLCYPLLKATFSEGRYNAEAIGALFALRIGHNDFTKQDSAVCWQVLLSLCLLQSSISCEPVSKLALGAGYGAPGNECSHFSGTCDCSS